MDKHTHTICRLLANELFECAWSFCGVGLKGLTLDRTGEIYQTIELTTSHAKAFQQETSYSNDYNADAIQRNSKEFKQSSKRKMIRKCKFCSYTHKSGSCPAYDKVCNSCYQKGHFLKCCVNFKRQDLKQININESKFYDSNDEHLFKAIKTSNLKKLTKNGQ